MTAAAVVAAVAEQGGQTIALWVAVLGLIGAVVAAVVTGGFGLAGKRGEVRVDATGQLTASQIKFIETVQKDNRELRERVDRLEDREDQLVQRVGILEDLLRQNGIPVPPPLRFTS